jgi:alpha-tubulin suppressor-like RCC1 family protein
MKLRFDGVMLASWFFAASAAAQTVEVDAGTTVSCARRADGSIRCWGTGALGDGGETFTRRMGAVLEGPAQALALGGGHGCAIVDGRVLCWGENGRGQLGDGTTRERLRPARVALRSAPTLIAAGALHSCAATATSVYCWGRNDAGQLGDGTTRDRPRPVRVRGIERAVTALALGDEHSCAVVDGAVVCWGGDDFGELGRGSAGVDQPVPALVAGLRGLTAVEVAAGSHHSCASFTDGTVRCWGDNPSGELGDGTTSDRRDPTLVSLAGRASRLAAGATSTCAVLEGGALYCWGRRAGPSPSSAPTWVRGDVREVRVGRDVTCFTTTDGSGWCWGSDLDGAVDGGTGTRDTPVRVDL